MTDPFATGLEEARWLRDHPEFKMRPATIREFVGPGYLDEPKIRPGVMAALEETFGDEITNDISIARKACITGGIGIGKSTFASVALTYMVHWVKCLKDPQDYYGLMKGTVISFMMMSTSEKNAQDVIFTQVKARVNNSDWFKKYSPVINEKMTKQLRFHDDIHLVPGTSEETSFEGHNVLGGILDEGDSHKNTPAKGNYADAGYDAMNSRIASRYPNFTKGSHRGLIVVIGQMKSATGFMNRKYDEFQRDPNGIAVRMTIWESFGWHYYTTDPKDQERGIETAPRDIFYFDTARKKIYGKAEGELILNKDMVPVPTLYLDQFKDDPVKALRDLAGIPPKAEDPFVANPDKIIQNQDEWHKYIEAESPIGDSGELAKIILPEWFRPVGMKSEAKRVIHIDTAYSPKGDALGLAMGHIPYKVNRRGEERPIIVFDLLLRIHAVSGTEIGFADVREFIYLLRDLGFDIDLVTMDGFNTTDFRQQLKRNHIKTDYISMDKTKNAYEDLRETINDVRCWHPNYQVFIKPSDTKTSNIAYVEISELTDTGRKIDHPPTGSKDVADAMAGVTHVLMTQSKYQRAARTLAEGNEDEQMASSIDDLFKVDDTGTPNSTVLSFEEFQRNASRHMQEAEMPKVDFDFMTEGYGTPGYSTGDDRTW